MIRSSSESLVKLWKNFYEISEETGRGTRSNRLDFESRFGSFVPAHGPYYKAKLPEYPDHNLAPSPLYSRTLTIDRFAGRTLGRGGAANNCT